MKPRAHGETHRAARAWLRAAVLGSDDAIVSTASLMLGVAETSASSTAIVITGVAGLVAGAMSMAVGEFVSVSSQRDSEDAEIAREQAELASEPQAELEELVAIYIKRGVAPGLARQVAEQLMASDPLGAHMRDELGIDGDALANPLQAALASAASFAVFATVPIIALLVSPIAWHIPAIAVASLLALGSLGAFGGYLGGAPVARAALRVTIGGALAMTVTAAIGRLLGVSLG